MIIASDHRFIKRCAMPKTTFARKEPVIDDVTDFIKLQDLGNLTIEDKERNLLRHSVLNPAGKVVANLVAKDRVALDSNSVEILDPSVYWFFFDLVTRYETEHNDTVAITCRFTEDKIPPREA